MKDDMEFQEKGMPLNKKERRWDAAAYSIVKYLYWRSQKVFPATTTQQLPGRDQL